MFSKKEGFMNSSRNLLCRPKKEILPSLPRNIPCIVSIFRETQTLAKKCKHREISLQIINEKITLSFEEREKT
jgi:hypothetical protein